jgi:mRNA-degrading endonuclease RelE of RelBE toxin-antitoxin system
MTHVELSKRAVRDLRKLGRGPMLGRIWTALEELGRMPPPPNLDVKPLTGRAPWKRLRVGDFRILFRPLTSEELASLGERKVVLYREGVLVERVVNRQDLAAAVAALG